MKMENRRKASLTFFLTLLALAAGLWWDGRRDYWGFSPRTARHIIAEAQLEEAVSLSVMGNLTGWQPTRTQSDPGLLSETLELLRQGKARKMGWYGAPTPEEIWIFSLGRGREVLVAWWALDEAEDPTITGDVYGGLPAEGDCLVEASREGFRRIRQQLLWKQLGPEEP